MRSAFSISALWVSSLLVLAVGCDDTRFRSSWFHHLAWTGRYDEAWDVFSELEATEREKPSLRYIALRCRLGSLGHDGDFIQRLEQQSGTHPSALWNHPIFESLSPEEWTPLGERASELSREFDRARYIRLFFAVRVVSALAQIRFLHANGHSTSRGVIALREAFDHAATGIPTRRRFKRIDERLDRIREIHAELSDLHSDAEVIDWLEGHSR